MLGSQQRKTEKKTKKGGYVKILVAHRTLGENHVSFNVFNGKQFSNDNSKLKYVDN